MKGFVIMIMRFILILIMGLQRNYIMVDPTLTSMYSAMNLIIMALVNYPLLFFYKNENKYKFQNTSFKENIYCPENVYHMSIKYLFQFTSLFITSGINNSLVSHLLHIIIYFVRWTRFVKYLGSPGNIKILLIHVLTSITCMLLRYYMSSIVTTTTGSDT